MSASLDPFCLDESTADLTAEWLRMTGITTVARMATSDAPLSLLEAERYVKAARRARNLRCRIEREFAHEPQLRRAMLRRLSQLFFGSGLEVIFLNEP